MKKKKNMAAMTRKQQLRDLKKTIQERQNRSNSLREEVWELEQQTYLEQTKSQWDVVQKLAKRFDVEVEEIEQILRGIHRRHRIQGRRANRAFAKVERKAKRIVRRELASQKKMRRRYFKTHGKKIKARSGNPELKFLRAEGHWAHAVRTPDRGMHGWGFDQPDTGSWDYETDMEVDYDFDPMQGESPAHMFYPKARVETGDIDNPMELELQQSLVLSHNPLVAGRGDFNVTGVRADFFGGGLSHARMGDSCSGGHNLWDNTELSLKIEVFQIVEGDSPASWEWLWTETLNERFEAGSGNHVTPVRVELGTQIALPDVYIRNNGLEPWLYIYLKTRVTAADKDAFSELNFSRADTFGLQMGCVTLIGNYEP